MTNRNVSNKDEFIDTRDLIAHIERLESLKEDDDFDDAMEAELKSLKIFAEEVEHYCEDYIYGEALIRESAFVGYVKNLAYDTIEELRTLTMWPFNCIDWKQAAKEIRNDYMSAELEGVKYLFQ